MKYRNVIVLILPIALVLTLSMSIAGQAADDISEITLQMTPGSSGGMDLKVVLRRDGTASYKGGNSQKLHGKFKGAVSVELFGQLAKFISDRSFFSIRNSFISTGAFPSSIGAPTVTPAIVSTTVVAAGKRNMVEYPIGVKVNEQKDPSKELLQINNAIMNVATQIKWTKDGN